MFRLFVGVGFCKGLSFYILPAVFVEEICRDFDKGKVCAVLHAASWLKYNTKGNRWQHQIKGKGRFYLICGVLPPSEMDESDE